MRKSKRESFDMLHLKQNQHPKNGILFFLNPGKILTCHLHFDLYYSSRATPTWFYCQEWEDIELTVHIYLIRPGHLSFCALLTQSIMMFVSHGYNVTVPCPLLSSCGWACQPGTWQPAVLTSRAEPSCQRCRTPRSNGRSASATPYTV